MMMTMMTTKRKRKMIKGRISGKIVMMMMMMMKDINHLMMNMKIREEADTNMRRRNITVKLIKKINSTKTSWDQQRSHEREKQRKEKTRSDWIFERAKQRKDVRYEETRGDWYFNRKYGRETHEEQKHCSSKDKDCKEKSKGEKYLRRDRGKSDKMKSKGENKRFHEKVQYQ